MPEEYNKIVGSITEAHTQHLKYYKTAEEMYARGINLKVWLIQNNQMKDINEDIEAKHIEYFLQNLRKQKLYDTDFFAFVLFLDFEQIY
jgi:hypothetical protein